MGYGIVFLKCSWKLRNLRLWKTNLNSFIWFKTSPCLQRCHRKFNPTLLHWATAFFLQMVLENIQFIYTHIWTLPDCSKFPPGSRNDVENSIRPFSIWLRDFFQKLFIWFLKKVSPRIFKGPFFIRSNIEPVFCPLVSPSVPQSVHQNVQYFLNRPRACFLSIENKFSFFFLVTFKS